MLRKCNVVMLPTEKAGEQLKGHRLWLNGNNDLLDTVTSTPETLKPQYLYFVSDEEIKEGDYLCYNNIIGKCLWIKKTDNTNNDFITMNGNVGGYRDKCRKIVATTNPDLWSKKVGYSIIQGDIVVPNIPKIGLDFIEAYVREQGKIEEIELEYVELNSDNHGFDISGNLHKALKLRDNGTVIIHPVKPKVYTEEDMKAFAMAVSMILDYNRNGRSIFEVTEECFKSMEWLQTTKNK